MTLPAVIVPHPAPATPPSTIDGPNFAARLIAWQKLYGRHALPWQKTRDAYRVWLSEIMLQQTQVAAVIPYYCRFLERFPDMPALAAAPEDDVLALWSGLGYYSRARNLHRAARLIMDRHGGAFPGQFEAIVALPGIGRSTAAAISVFAFSQRRAILDGNAKRVFARQFGVEGYPGEACVAARLWLIADTELPQSDVKAYTQGLMDLGATLCKRTQPACARCPVATTCVALALGRVKMLPQRKAAQALPLKQTTMLIIRDRGLIMLQKRPPRGVWAALWCFPECPPGVDLPSYCLRAFGLSVAPQQPYPKLAHGFTHFRLDITPQPLTVIERQERLSDARHLWLSAEDALRVGIPAPVRKLLAAETIAPLFRAVAD